MASSEQDTGQDGAEIDWRAILATLAIDWNLGVREDDWSEPQRFYWLRYGREMYDEDGSGAFSIVEAIECAARLTAQSSSSPSRSL